MDIKVYTPEEVAKILKVNYRFILDEINRGNIKASKIARGYRITKEALNKYIANNTISNKDDNFVEEIKITVSLKESDKPWETNLVDDYFNIILDGREFRLSMEKADELQESINCVLNKKNIITIPNKLMIKLSIKEDKKLKDVVEELIKKYIEGEIEID